MSNLRYPSQFANFPVSSLCTASKGILIRRGLQNERAENPQLRRLTQPQIPPMFSKLAGEGVGILFQYASGCQIRAILHLRASPLLEVMATNQTRYFGR